nr:MAG TPA: hypothetical protein [Caudoviricetes sp.]DAR21667.1 MAG TPA: hypothetical protein [Caudoviricetes sp.]
MFIIEGVYTRRHRPSIFYARIGQERTRLCRM